MVSRWEIKDILMHVLFIYKNVSHFSAHVDFNPMNILYYFIFTIYILPLEGSRSIPKVAFEGAGPIEFSGTNFLLNIDNINIMLKKKEKDEIPLELQNTTAQ